MPEISFKILSGWDLQHHGELTSDSRTSITGTGEDWSMRLPDSVFSSAVSPLATSYGGKPSSRHFCQQIIMVEHGRNNKKIRTTKTPNVTDTITFELLNFLQAYLKCYPRNSEHVHSFLIIQVSSLLWWIIELSRYPAHTRKRIRNELAGILPSMSGTKSCTAFIELSRYPAHTRKRIQNQLARSQLPRWRQIVNTT